jgi:hypothetical protein
MTVTRIAFRSAIRSAAVDLITAYAADAGVKLQVYPGRPRTVAAPCAFVEVIRETFAYTNVSWRLRTPTLEIIVLHGAFDSKDAVEAADAFADGFLDWWTDRYHAAGGNTLTAITGIEDEPTYVPDWLPPNEQKTYYASRLTVEGIAGG